MILGLECIWTIPNRFRLKGIRSLSLRCLQNSEKAYYGVYEIVDGKLIGNQCVINGDIEKTAESGQYIFPSEQGHGYGTLMKYEFIDYLFKQGLLQRIIEKVKKFNERNNRLNLKLGFRLYESDSEYNYYEVNPKTLNAQ